MLKFSYLFIFLFIVSYPIAQVNFDGTWQGVIVKSGEAIENSTLLYLEIHSSNNIVSGHSREEVNSEDNFFAVKHLKGEVENNHLSLQQTVVSKSKNSSRVKWCRLKMNLTYDSITGYLTGDFKSTDCRRVQGKIILYRSDFKLSKTDQPGTSQLWFPHMLYDLREGLNAPEIREKEQENFLFQPVYFDFDKAIIKPEYDEFLQRLIKIVKGHSDLRVKVTGHTDADGTDNYNIALSQRRAQAIIDYFVRNGLKADRLVFDFKGEKMPIAPNTTREGKQQNGRVDFSFI